jgi:RNase P subunit RPR2
MEPTDQFNRVASTDVFCGRCSRPMAIQRLRYADPASGFSSVDYKCLSCGHEDMQPYQSENLSAPAD